MANKTGEQLEAVRGVLQEAHEGRLKAEVEAAQLRGQVEALRRTRDDLCNAWGWLRRTSASLEAQMAHVYLGCISFLPTKNALRQPPKQTHESLTPTPAANPTLHPCLLGGVRGTEGGGEAAQFPTPLIFCRPGWPLVPV